MMVSCPTCGREINNEKFCPNCGTAIPNQNGSSNTKFCSNCGDKIDIKAEICPKCGVRQSGFSTSSDKNVWVAVLLSLLIVGLGHFYLGLPKKGALLLILTIISWILIAVVIGVILYPLILIYGVYDAYQSAVALSEGRHVEDELFGGKFL